MAGFLQGVGTNHFYGGNMPAELLINGVPEFQGVEVRLKYVRKPHD
jgi:hypothetical protein